jgi:hypothetical protein
MSSAFVEHARNDHKSSVRFPMQSSPIQWDGQPASRAINLSRAMWPYGVATAIAVLAITICRRQAKCVQHMPWHHQAKKSYREHCCKDHDRDYFLHYATPYALNPPLSLNAPSNLRPVQYARRNEHPRPLREATWHLLGNFSHRPIATTISPLFDTSLSRVSGYSRKYPCRKRQYLPASIPQKFSCWQPVS